MTFRKPRSAEILRRRSSAEVEKCLAQMTRHDSQLHQLVETQVDQVIGCDRNVISVRSALTKLQQLFASVKKKAADA